MNQNPQQQARDQIDQQLTACGWTIQNKSSINLHAGSGEAKLAEDGVCLTVHEEQNQFVQEMESYLMVADKLEETIANSLQQPEALRRSI